jgi:hypothetical protein
MANTFMERQRGNKKGRTEDIKHINKLKHDDIYSKLN